METEIEATFADINVDEIRAKLRDMGATLVQPEILMRRKVYDHPTNKQNDWFRVRDEGDKITLSYKKLNERSAQGMKEINMVVPDFDKACAILEATQLHFGSYQETKRETWQKDGVDITIDTWPWVPTFLEIEGHSEDDIKKIASELGLDWQEALFGSVENVYQKYYDVTEADVNSWSEMKLSPVPEWLEVKRKQK
jgi:adenylate cyclase class 2